MSMRELDRLKVVEAVIEQRLMPWRAAERLGISRRQIERLVARYRAAGPGGLVIIVPIFTSFEAHLSHIPFQPCDQERN